MIIRAAFLAIWVALMDMWLARHFHAGVGWSELSMLIGVPVGSLWCVGVIDFLVGKEEREAAELSLKNYFRDFIKTHLSTRVLVVLFLVSTLFGSTYTSVNIGPISDGGSRDIRLKRVTDQMVVREGAMAPNQGEDLRLWINPLAAQYELEVAGFLPRVITLRPFFGTTVIPSRDLVQIPTVLFRPSARSYIFLGNGWFELYHKQNDIFVKLTEDRGAHAWYIGPRRNQSSELRTEWQLETKAQDVGEQDTAILMRRWRNPKPLATMPLGPGEVICALVTNVDRVAVAGVVGSITREEYIDLPLGGYQSDPNNPKPGNAVCADLDRGAN